jgi:hypothetical protein
VPEHLPALDRRDLNLMLKVAQLPIQRRDLGWPSYRRSRALLGRPSLLGRGAARRAAVLRRPPRDRPVAPGHGADPGRPGFGLGRRHLQPPPRPPGPLALRLQNCRGQRTFGSGPSHWAHFLAGLASRWRSRYRRLLAALTARRRAVIASTATTPTAAASSATTAGTLSEASPLAYGGAKERREPGSAGGGKAWNTLDAL